MPQITQMAQIMINNLPQRHKNSKKHKDFRFATDYSDSTDRLYLKIGTHNTLSVIRNP